MPKKWQVCTILFVATTLNYLDRQAMGILAPALAKELRLDNEALGWLFAVFYYSYTFSMIAAGPMLDRSNLRWAFALAVFLWSMVSVTTSLATGFVALAIFRLFLGMVESVNWPAGMRIVARLLEPRERALGNGIFTSGTSVGALVAPAIILGIAATFGWRWAFVLIGSFGLIWIVVWMKMTRDPKLASVWCQPTGQPRVGFIRQMRIFGEITRSPRFVPVLIIAVLVNPCIYFSVNWLPTYFAQQRGVTPGERMGWILTAIYLGLDLGNLACGGAILMLTREHRSIRRARRIVFSVATASIVFCAAVPILPISGAVFSLVLVNFGLGIWAAMYLTMAQEASQTHISTAIGILSGCGSLAGAVAMWAVGGITQYTRSFSIPMSGLAIAAILAGMAGWLATSELKPEKARAHD